MTSIASPASVHGVPARNVAVLGEIAGWLTTSEQPKLVLYADPGLIVFDKGINEWLVGGVCR